jgi:alpha-beta hydrolase superfamily lysophospholipase
MLEAPEFSKRLFFPPARISPVPPSAEDHFVKVDGASLHVRVHGKERRGLVLLFHGNGEVVSDWDPAASRFAALGYRFAVVDYRGYGRSTGAPQMAHLIGDARPVYDYVGGLGLPIVLMGRSLGSAAAWEIAGSSPPGLAGLVIDSGFSDVDAFVRRRGFEPSALLAEERALIDPLPKIARTHVPTLLLHGEQDRVIAIEDAERAFEALSADESRLARIAMRGHNDIGLDSEYWQALIHFLNARA